MPGRRAAERRGGSRLRAGQPEDSQTHCPGQQLTPVGFRYLLSVPFSFSSPAVSALSRWVERGRPRPAGGGEARRPCAEGRPGAAAFRLPPVFVPSCCAPGGEISRGAVLSASVLSLRAGGSDHSQGQVGGAAPLPSPYWERGGMALFSLLPQTNSGFGPARGWDAGRGCLVFGLAESCSPRSSSEPVWGFVLGCWEEVQLRLAAGSVWYPLLGSGALGDQFSLARQSPNGRILHSV